MSPNNPPIITLFAQNEKKVKELYEIYGRNFPSDRLLWDELTEKETEHVKILTDLEKKYQEEVPLFEENRFSRKIVSYISDFIDEELNKIKNNSVDAVSAIETAIQIENSMIENKCFDTFIPKSEEIRLALKKLNEDTQDHTKLLRKALLEKN